MKKYFLSLFLITLFFSCSKKEDEKKIIKVKEEVKKETETKKETKTETKTEEKTDKVSAEDGGEGFEDIAESLGYITNMDYKGYSSPNAVKGGVLLDYMQEEPGTFRYNGINSHTATVAGINVYSYQSMLGYDLETKKFYPAIANYWKKEMDGSTQIYHYRINPHARFWDGTPITTDDVIASYKLFCR